MPVCQTEILESFMALNLPGVSEHYSYSVMKNEHIEIPSDQTLAARDCQPCESGKSRLKPATIRQLLKQLDRHWKLKNVQLIERTFKFPDFKEALDFTNRVGEIAESQNHHPNIHLTYGEVSLQLATHQAKGLTENDFILAAKIDGLA